MSVAAICAAAQMIFFLAVPDLLCSKPACWAGGLYFVFHVIVDAPLVTLGVGGV